MAALADLGTPSAETETMNIQARLLLVERRGANGGQPARLPFFDAEQVAVASLVKSWPGWLKGLKLI